MKTGKGLELLQKVAKTNSGNVVVSPFGVELVLRLLEKGASGNTLERIKSLLPETINIGTDVETSVGVFVDTAEELLEEYTETIKTSGARVESVNFSDTEAAANSINAIVHSETDGKISEFIKPSSLIGVVLLFLSIITLKVTWKEKFDPKNTYQGNFQLENGKGIMTDFMTQIQTFEVIESEEAEGIIMTVTGDKTNVVLLKPTTGKSINNVLEVLKEDGVLSLSGLSVKEKKIDLHVPKLNLKFCTSLVKALMDLGLDTIFNLATANFSRMINGKIAISEFLQESCLIINEEGVEAAAATAAMAARSIYIPPKIKFDKPFIALVTDNTAKNIMFAAIVHDPTAS